MKFTIITVCYNSEATISKAINSVISQKNIELEYIIIDGGSKDNTINIIKGFKNSNIKFFSERDNGIYDAMNKGFYLSTGDYIGYLNSDDFYIDNLVLNDIYLAFNSGDYDYAYGNINIVSENGSIVRNWVTGEVNKFNILKGFQIPHPAFFCKKSSLEKLTQPFDSNYKIAADLKQQLALIFLFECKGIYINRILAIMAIGGKSTKNIFSYLEGLMESSRAFKDITGNSGLSFAFFKFIRKIKGYHFTSLY